MTPQKSQQPLGASLPSSAPPSSRSASILAAGVAAAFFCVYGIFRSNHYTAVDGGVRCLEVFSKNKPFIHDNNHMLYPVHVYYFNRLLGALGWMASDGFQYFSRTTVLNALAAGLSLGLFFDLLTGLGIPIIWSATGVLMVAYSECFLLNATNPNEPMPGYFLSLLAVWLHQKSRSEKILPGFLSGLALSYSMATYESMISVFPALLVCYGAPLFRGPRSKRRQAAAVSASFLAGALVAGFSIYFYCYHRFYGLNRPGDFLARLLSFHGGGPWGLHPRKLVLTYPLVILPALILALFHLPFFGLAETFVQHGSAATVSLWLAASVMTAGLIGHAFMKLPRIAANKNHLNLTLAPLLFFLFSSVVPIYWEYSYSKLWLQPITAFAALVAVVLGCADSSKSAPNNNSSPGHLSAQAYPVLFVCVLASWNLLGTLIPNHRGMPGYVRCAEIIDQNTEADAMVVSEWDSVSQIFTNFFGKNRTLIDLPSFAIRFLIPDKLNEKIIEAMRRQRSVYFVGILDTVGINWRFWETLHVRPEAFRKFQAYSQRVERLSCDDIHVALFRLHFPEAATGHPDRIGELLTLPASDGDPTPRGP